MANVHWLDYTIFVVIMLLSLATGVYFSLKKQNTEDYLYGRRKMSVIPVSASLVVSFISAVTMMGIPAEVYVYGIQFSVMLLNLGGMWIAAVTFVPLYHPLKLTSVYQYLEMRFNSKPLVILGYVLGICTANLFMGIILYAPATGLESVIGVPTWINIICVSVVCTIYTAIGGMKAVVWNDTFQALVMFAGLVTVIIAGMVKVGGIGEVWYELERRNRTNIEFMPDPTLRMTLWFGIITLLSNWGLYSNQPAMMRYEAVPTIRKAQYTLILGSLGYFIIQFMAILAGAVVLAYYSKTGCEPMASGEINSPNQILPYFLVDALGLPGLPGLFLAAVVASSLSSISSVQNAMAAVVWTEVILPCIGPVSDFKQTLGLKMIVVFFGFISTMIAFGAKYVGGTLVQISMLVLSVTDAPPTGIFFLGAIFTFTGGTAAFLACLCSIILCTCLHLGRFYTGVSWPMPPLIDENCHILNESYTNLTSNITLQHYSTIHENNSTVLFGIHNMTNSEHSWSIFRLSPYLYSSMGIATTIITGVLFSLFPCLRHKKLVESKLLFPFVRKIVGSSIGGIQMETIKMDNVPTLTKVIDLNALLPEEQKALMETTDSSNETVSSLAKNFDI